MPSHDALLTRYASLLNQATRHTRRRTYATISNTGDFQWPRKKDPSPFDILHLDRNATRSQIKQRYFELVKQFHPDKNNGDVERFRLVVKAYDLLYDPGKRDMYMRAGIGWGSSPDWSAPMRPRHESSARAGAGSGSESSYSTGWEDSSFFTGRKMNPEQTKTNPLMASIIIILASLGGVIQLMRLENASTWLQDVSERKHWEASRNLADARTSAKRRAARKGIVERINAEREEKGLIPYGIDVCQSQRVTDGDSSSVSVVRV